MTRSELTIALANRFPQLVMKDVDISVKEILDCKTACKTFQISGVISVQKLPPWVV